MWPGTARMWLGLTLELSSYSATWLMEKELFEKQPLPPAHSVDEPGNGTPGVQTNQPFP